LNRYNNKHTLKHTVMNITFKGIELEIDCDIRGRFKYYGHNNPSNEEPEIEINGVSVNGVDITEVFNFDAFEEELITKITENL
jgi:hypothetical protein